MVRDPIAAGKFYLKGEESLKESIQELFSGKRGPKNLENKNAKAIVAPHAGYKFSGPCAAWSYEALSGTEADTFIILGTNHSGRGPKLALSNEDFKTPFGRVEVNKKIVTALKNNTKAEVSQAAHQYEHSIEVQLPFLQYLFEDFKIVPILVSKEEPEQLSQLAKRFLNFEDIALIASSDFTHYGNRYGFTPFRKNIREQMEELDKKAIQKILDLDPERFYEFAKNNTSICGYLPITLLTYYAGYENLEGTHLKYYTSGDIIGSHRNSVGYASIAFH